jgi:organic radical activating enzyme
MSNSVAAIRTDALLVAETFTSFQGEGPSAGRPAAFIRLSRCNLACSFCDTPYTWDWTRFHPGTEATWERTDDLTAWALQQNGRIVITGGEPLIQQERLVPLAARIAQSGREVEVETNGTITPLPDLVKVVTQFNVSPKLSRSAVPESRRIIPDALRVFADSGRAAFKFVICDISELDEVVTLESRLGLAPVWVMPQGTNEQTVVNGMRAIADVALERGWSLSSRLQVLLWGDERGR